MRALLGVAVAAAALFGTMPAAHATCMPHYDYGVVYSYSCAAPGGPVTTYTCNRVTNECWVTTSGGGGEDPPHH